MSNAKHTPTPWRLIEVMGSSSIHGYDKEIGHIEILNYYTPVPTSKANAAFIVTAVNAFEPMREALRAYTEFEKGEPVLSSRLEKARQILASLEGSAT